MYTSSLPGVEMSVSSVCIPLVPAMIVSSTSSLLSVAMSVSSIMCKCVVCVSSPGPPPFTFRNVRNVLIKIPARLWGKWDKQDDYDNIFNPNFQCALNVSLKQQRLIGSKCATNSDRISASINHYLLNSDHPSWRGIIVSLDEVKETLLADSIRDWAEPLKGQTNMYTLVL